jgi:hypothetical protein
LSSNGVVTVYAKSPDHALVQAIANINPKADPVKFVTSTFSYNQLQGLVADLGKHADKLQRAGVSLSEWGPEPPFDAVYISVQRPTNDDLRRLSSSSLIPTSLIPVTRANYIEAASAAISTAAGPNYRVHHTYQDRAHAN